MNEKKKTVDIKIKKCPWRKMSDIQFALSLNDPEEDFEQLLERVKKMLSESKRNKASPEQLEPFAYFKNARTSSEYFESVKVLDVWEENWVLEMKREDDEESDAELSGNEEESESKGDNKDATQPSPSTAIQSPAQVTQSPAAPSQPAKTPPRDDKAQIESSIQFTGYRGLEEISAPPPLATPSPIKATISPITTKPLRPEDVPFIDLGKVKEEFKSKHIAAPSPERMPPKPFQSGGVGPSATMIPPSRVNLATTTPPSSPSSLLHEHYQGPAPTHYPQPTSPYVIHTPTYGAGYGSSHVPTTTTTTTTTSSYPSTYPSSNQGIEYLTPELHQDRKDRLGLTPTQIAKNALLNYYQVLLGRELPTFHVTPKGADHLRVFYAEVDVSDLLVHSDTATRETQLRGYGFARKKTEAENLAAVDALYKLKRYGVTTEKVTPPPAIDNYANPKGNVKRKTSDGAVPYLLAQQPQQQPQQHVQQHVQQQHAQPPPQKRQHIEEFLQQHLPQQVQQQQPPQQSHSHSDHFYI